MESLSYAFDGRRPLFTDHTVESIGFSEPILPEMSKNSFLSDQCLESFCDDTNNHSDKSSTVTLNSIMEFGARFSSSGNVGKLSAPRKADHNRFSLEPSAKRAKITNSQSSNPTCQVHGCNKDLSSSKDYHKRHKVCDVHSKTSVVIVNGIQQRFCQQCSRFHILAEFDEGKRSCRKRLAGHNERRRKPQFNSYLGSTYLTTHASKTSLLFSSILPSGFFDSQCNNPINPSKLLKLENDPSQISEVAANIKFCQSLPKSAMGKKYPSKYGLNIPLSVQESSLGSNSSCALSLLSAQSHNLIRNSAGASITNQNYYSDLRTLQNSAKPVPKHTSENYTRIDEEISLDELNAVNRKIYLSPEGSETVNLLELSLQLQRVEQQKYSGEVKLENGTYWNNTYT